MIKRAQNIITGDTIVNIGKVEKVTTYEVAETVEILVTNGVCLSCCFYWFRYNTTLMVILEDQKTSSTDTPGSL